MLLIITYSVINSYAIVSVLLLILTDKAQDAEFGEHNEEPPDCRKGDMYRRSL